MTAPLVRPARPSDLPGAAEALADAFTDDPTFAFLPSGERARRVRAYMDHELDGAWTVDVAVDGTTVLGAGLWQPPGSHVDGIAAAARHLAGLWSTLGSHAVTMLRVERELTRHRPPVPHWFLGYVGVSSAAQGRGVGRALLEYRLGTVAEPVYLEAATERAAALYLRLGFVDMCRFTGPHMPAVGMWRPAPLPQD